MTDDLFFDTDCLSAFFCGLIRQTYYMNFMVGELFCQSLSIKNYQIHASHI